MQDVDFSITRSIFYDSDELNFLLQVISYSIDSFIKTNLLISSHDFLRHVVFALVIFKRQVKLVVSFHHCFTSGVCFWTFPVPTSAVHIYWDVLLKLPGVRHPSAVNSVTVADKPHHFLGSSLGKVFRR